MASPSFSGTWSGGFLWLSVITQWVIHSCRPEREMPLKDNLQTLPNSMASQPVLSQLCLHTSLMWPQFYISPHYISPHNQLQWSSTSQVHSKLRLDLKCNTPHPTPSNCIKSIKYHQSLQSLHPHPYINVFFIPSKTGDTPTTHLLTYTAASIFKYGHGISLQMLLWLMGAVMSNTAASTQMGIWTYISIS